jgi:3,4-dihydroxy 2-butanone 4-phosphate synthase / GTP cyclohydrolase II
MFASPEELIEAIGRGDMVIMVDDADRENEGDLIVAADRVTEAQMAFMIRHTSGIVCIPMEGAARRTRTAAHGAPQHRVAPHGIHGLGGRPWGHHHRHLGVRPHRTVEACSIRRTRPGDLARPGHMYPLRYAEGGVLKRAGHTEASVDLARLAGRYPAAVLSEVMNDDGTVARLPELERFAKEHDLLIGTIAEPHRLSA